MAMAFNLLRRVMFSFLKPLSCAGHNGVHYSTMSLNGFTQYSMPRSLLSFRSSVFLTNNNLLPSQQALGLKTKTVLKKRCKDCYIVKRRGRFYVCCKSNGKHKQRQG